MRKLILASLIGGLTGAAMLATAADPLQSSPEARAYLNFAFGGKYALPKNFHYGLKLDHDRRYVEAGVPAIMQADFDSRGLVATRLNGLNLVERHYLTQDEGEAAPSGDGMTYTMADWGLMALGVVGIGFIATEVTNADESDNPQPVPAEEEEETLGGLGGLPGGGLPGGGLPGGGTPGGAAAGGLPGGLGGVVLMLPKNQVLDAERQRWLDGGTGQMGDLPRTN